ncbi:MAG: hypothetical protein J6332_01120 [Abditibacteriota bacterium]|nr:hypothetical protein [Abditibacteriota bacterium]
MKKLLIVLLLALSSSSFAAKTIPVTDENVYFSPYTWKTVTSGGVTTREAVLPGAYIKITFKSTSSFGLVVDATATKGVTGEVPVIEYTIDNGPYKTASLATNKTTYTISMASGLTSGNHTAVIYLKSSNVRSGRYKTKKSHLIVKGFEVADNGVTVAQNIEPKRIIGYGDSITEGVVIESGGGPNARCAWLPMVAAALNCEYGQVGIYAIGFSKGADDWPLFQETWDKYDYTASRLVNGKFDPEPDYILLSMGTNDPENSAFLTAYQAWMVSVRAAAPNAVLVLIVPPSGSHRAQITQAVTASSDDNIILIDPTATNDMVRPTQGAATGMAYDGIHPNMYGQGMYAACVAALLAKELEAR